MKKKNFISLFPFLGWQKLNQKTIKADFLAGLLGALIVIPQGIAFAAIAGLPPAYGLYAAIVPTIIAALFGSSWHLVSGPTTAISLVVFGALVPFAEPESSQFILFATTLSFLVGILQFTMGIFRMGTLVNFISHTVVVAFTAGAALLIIASQIKNFFGISIPSGLHFYEILFVFFTKISEINFFAFCIAISTFISGILMKKFFPKKPYILVAMLVGVLMGLLLNFFSPNSFPTVAPVYGGLPPFKFPDFSFETIKMLLSGAFAITLLALTEAVSIARAVATKSGQKIDGNQEFIGQGLSNIIGSFFSAYPSSGSFNRSGVNYESGAKTPLSSIFAAIILIPIIFIIAPYTQFIPLAVMGGILFLVGWGLIDFKTIKKISKTSSQETIIFLATFLATLFLELEFAIFSGVLMSFFLYLNRTSHPTIFSCAPNAMSPKHRMEEIKKGTPICPQLQMIKIEDALFFGAVNDAENTMKLIETMQPFRLIIAHGISFVDLSGVEFLEQEVQKAKQNGIEIFFCGFKKEVYDFLKKSGFTEKIGEDHIFSSKKDAIESIIQKFDLKICSSCTSRIFHECPSS